MSTFTDAAFFAQQKSVAEFLQHEMEQFRQQQHLPYEQYKSSRLAFLAKQKHAEASLDFLKVFQPRIAVFAGSFNPFHQGHYNVLQKAEKIFDKVIIAIGKNPDKDQRSWGIPKSITNRQIVHYDGLLTDMLTAVGGEPVLIRGLRNSTDFQYEQNQYRYMQELMPSIKIVNIYCDKEFEHISSSGIRTLEKFDKHRKYLLE